MPRPYSLVLPALLATSCTVAEAADPDAGSAPAQAKLAPADEPFQISLATGQLDADGNTLGGTELINLVAFRGALYAGNGYWTDPHPTSGPQILVLDSPHGAWRQDHAFSERTADHKLRFGRLTALAALTFTTDASGTALPTPVSMLIAGLELRGSEGSGAVFSRDDAGTWTELSLPTTDRSFRSLGVHRDRVTGIDHVFAGGGRGTGGTRGAIFAGVYDPSAHGRIRFAATPEFTGFKNRVMAFEEVDGTLYFAAKPSIYARSDGPAPTWRAVFTDPRAPLAANNSGARGLTAVVDPLGSGHHVLLTGLEGVDGSITRIDPTGPSGTATTELDLDARLTADWGPLHVAYTISAYNDMPLVHDAATGATLRVIGLQAHDPATAKARSAWYLTRDSADQSYRLHEVPPLTTLSPRGLVAVRTMIASPFPDDAGQVLYLGGYDADFIASHDTAWLYRVGLHTALR